MNLDLVLSNVQSLNCLPTDSLLVKPEYEVNQKILGQLLNASKMMSPIQWLVEQHPKLCIKTTMYLILKDTNVDFVDVQRSVRLDLLPETEKYKVDLVKSLEFDQCLKLLEQLVGTNPLTIQLELLITVYRALHKFIPQLRTSYRSLDEEWNQLNEVWFLPDDSSPLAWLENEHLEHSAMFTLRYLLNQILPDASLWDVSPTTRTIKSRCHSKPSGIKVNLKEVSLKEDAFSVLLSFRIFNNHLKIPSKDEGVRWHNVGQIMDNNGNCYLIYNFILGHTYRLPWWAYYELKLLCYPALSEDVEWIRLSFDNPIVNAIDIRSSNTNEKMYYKVPLGKLTWTVDIA